MMFDTLLERRAWFAPDRFEAPRSPRFPGLLTHPVPDRPAGDQRPSLLPTSFPRDRQVDGNAYPSRAERLADGHHDAAVHPAHASERDAGTDSELEAVGQAHAEDQRSGGHETVALHARDQEHPLDDEPRPAGVGAGLALEVPAELGGHVSLGQERGA